jgi:hypothetical protein
MSEEPTAPLPYPHARHDCGGCRELDAAMTATYPGQLGGPSLWCTRCAGTALGILVSQGRTVTVRDVDAPDAPTEQP